MGSRESLLNIFIERIHNIIRESRFSDSNKFLKYIFQSRGTREIFDQIPLSVSVQFGNERNEPENGTLPVSIFLYELEKETLIPYWKIKSSWILVQGLIIQIPFTLIPILWLS